MGRPKNNTEAISAAEKIENAFWKILELEGFESVTVLRLTQETGLNRNTIYYHYQNVKDVADQAIEHNMQKEDVTAFMAILLSAKNDFEFHPELLLRTKRIHLLAGSRSPFIQSFVKKKLIDTWLEFFCIDSGKLSLLDHISLDFMASGITSILGGSSFIDSPELICAFPTSLVGKATIQTLQSFPRKEEVTDDRKTD